MRISLDGLCISWIVFCFIGAMATLSGWIINLVSVIHADYAEISVREGLGIIGVAVPPVGAILGLFF